MSFIDGYISLCSSAGSGAVAEQGLQPRQPVSFAVPKPCLAVGVAAGVARNATPFVFTYQITGLIAGFGIFDSPTGGNLLLVLPFAPPRGIIGGGQAYRAEPGDLYLEFPALAGLPLAEAFSTTFAAGAVLGSFFDTAGIMGAGSVATPQGYLPAGISSTPLTAGVGLVLDRGVLRPASATA